MKTFSRKERRHLCDTDMAHIQCHLETEEHRKLKHLSITLDKSLQSLLKEAVALLLTYYTTPKGEVK
jgi:hypothetical protein